MKRMKNTLCACIGLAIALVFGNIQKASAAELHVGTATTSITPDLPVGLSGQIHARVSKGVESPVTAPALALESREGDNILDQAVFVSCDLVAVRGDGDFMARVRRHVQPLAPGFDVKKLILSATHTHTAPESREGIYPLPKEGVMQPADYATFLVERIGLIVADAWKNRRPGRAGWGLGHAVVGQNRRAVYADGTAKMYGNTALPSFRRIEGPEDHGVEVLFFWDQNQKLLAAAVNVACPAQEVENLSVVNADYWHQVRRRLRDRYGPELCVLGWIGAAGDQSPHLMYRKAAEERMRELRGLSRLDEIARRITAAVDEAYEGAVKDVRTDVPLVHLVQDVRLPVRMVTEKEYEEAKEGLARILKEQAEGKKATLYNIWHSKVITRYERQKTQPFHIIELHAIRLGDAAICTNPFELYTDYGIQIKARSKAVQTFVIQLTSGLLGSYLPTEQAVRGGGYSAEVMSNEIGPEGGQELVDRTVEAVNSLWPEP